MRHRKDRLVLRATKTESDFFREETQRRRETRGSRGGVGVRGRSGGRELMLDPVPGRERRDLTRGEN